MEHFALSVVLQSWEVLCGCGKLRQADSGLAGELGNRGTGGTAAPQAAASYAHSGETAQLEEERKVSAGVSSLMPSLAVVSLTCVSKDFFKHLILVLT